MVGSRISVTGNLVRRFDKAKGEWEAGISSDELPCDKIEPVR